MAMDLAQLGALTKAKYPTYAGMDDAAVGRLVAAKYPQYLAGGMMPSHAETYDQPAVQPAQEPWWAKGLPGTLAMGVGLPLSIAGSPAVGIPAAAVAGMIGKGIEANVRSRQGLPPYESMQGAGPTLETLSEGAKQGAGLAAAELGGKAATAGLSAAGQAMGKAATPLMQGVLRSSPEIAQTLLREGISVTRAGQKKIMDLIGQSGSAELAAARRAMNTASASGAPIVFTPDQIAQPVIAKMAQERQAAQLPPLTPAEVSKAVDQVRETSERLLGRRTFGIGAPSAQNLNPVQLIQLRQIADKASRGVYAAQEAGKPTAIDPDMARYVSEGARQVLGTIPDVASQARRTSELIAAKNAIWGPAKQDIGAAAQGLHAATSRAPWAGTMLGRGIMGAAPGGVEAAMGHAAIGLPMALAGVAGAGASVALDNPAAMSRLALSLYGATPSQALLKTAFGLGTVGTRAGLASVEAASSRRVPSTMQTARTP